MTKHIRSPKTSAVIKQMFPKHAIRTHDQFLDELHTTLPPNMVQEIIKLHRNGLKRSEIARKTGVNKVQVNNILMKLGETG